MFKVVTSKNTDMERLVQQNHVLVGDSSTPTSFLNTCVPVMANLYPLKTHYLKFLASYDLHVTVNETMFLINFFFCQISLKIIRHPGCVKGHKIASGQLPNNVYWTIPLLERGTVGKK